MRTFAAVFAVLVLFAPVAASDFSPDERAAFRICERYGFLAVKGRPIVDVTECLGTDEYGPWVEETWAFVLGDGSGDAKKILDASFVDRDLTPVDEPAKYGEAVLTPTDLESIVQRALNPPDREWPSFDSPGSADDDERRLVLAAQCRVLERPDLARKLLDALEPFFPRSIREQIDRRLRVAKRANWLLDLTFGND